MAKAALDALLGRLFNNGTELELLGGLNFIGFTITRDDANGRYDLSTAGAFVPTSRTITAGAGLTGGGDLTANRTIDVVAADTTITVNADSIQVGTVGNANFSNNTIALARLVNATNGSRFIMRGFGAGAGAWVEGAPVDVLAALSGNSIGALTIGVLNGVTVAAPIEGTALTDADQTLNVSGGNNYVQSTALTASRTKTLGTSGSPETGEVITITRTTTAAFTMPVVNGGGGGGTLYTFPSGGKRVADFRYDGTNWVLAGAKRIQ